MIRIERKTRVLTIIWLLSLTVAAAADQHQSPPASVSIGAFEAGVDYPTDAAKHANASVLVIDSKNRIVIGKQSTLATPTAGIDYPTDSPIPVQLKSAKILVLDGTHRVAVTLDRPRAGIDYPTNTRAPSSLVWVFGKSVRIPLSNIAALEHAVAGIDFPTDGPPTLDRSFYVAVTTAGKRTRIP